MILTTLETQLLDLVRRLVPYAETRAEDLSECADEYRTKPNPNGDIEHPCVSERKAWSAVEDAKRTLLEIDLVTNLTRKAVR